MRILMTGYSGYLGNHLFDLLQSKSEIELIYASSRTIDSSKNPRVNFIPYEKLLDGSFKDRIDAVIHLAAYRGIDPLEQAKAFKQFQALIFNLFKSGVGRFIHASSQAVYGVQPTPWSNNSFEAPVTSYAWSKFAEEQYLNLLGLFYKDVSIHSLRLAKLIGPGKNFPVATGEIPHIIADRILKNLPIVIPKAFLNQQLDFLDVRQAALIIEQLLINPTNKMIPRILNVSSGTPVSGKELLDLFSTYCNRDPDLKLQVQLTTEQPMLRNFGMVPDALYALLGESIQSISLNQTIEDIFDWLRRNPLI